MRVSTRGRYALRVLIDLAQHQGDAYIPLKDIAQRQNLSDKYLETIIALLVKDGLLTGLRGKGGGYKLTYPPDEYSVAQILRLTEGSLAPVACLEGEANCCPQANECATLDMWQGLHKRVESYLEGVSIASLAFGSKPPDNYMI